MQRACGVLLLLLPFATAHAVGPNNVLNDTGAVAFGNETQNNLTSEPASHPRQDSSFGRDAANAIGALPKVGAGPRGFDFTKVANNGGQLPDNAALGFAAGDWGCTYDNVTGLLWEVKVSAPTHLRSASNTYTWFNTDPATNGTFEGTPNGGNCPIAGHCDTTQFVADVNAAGLCGHTDWRLPRLKELESLIDFAVTIPGPTIVQSWFPNTAPFGHWTATAYNLDASAAWIAFFDTGASWSWQKWRSYAVRLVRQGL